MIRRCSLAFAALFALLLGPPSALAGPPFATTDDEGPAVLRGQPTGMTPLWRGEGARSGATAIGDPGRQPFVSAISLPEDAFWEGGVAPSSGAGFRAAIEFQGKLVFTGGSPVERQTGSNNWSWDGTAFAMLPPSGSVRLFGTWNGQLVAATVSTGPKHEILVLNGSTWDTLGTTNDQVETLAEFGGALVVGGRFTTLDGQPMNRIARFDGTAWSSFGAGFTTLGARVIDLTVHVGTLIATGPLSSTMKVASWDEPSSTWLPVGANFNAAVDATESDGTYLYASGPFTLSGAVSVRYFARWDGASWQQLGDGSIATGLPTKWNGGIAVRRSMSPSKVAFWDGAQLVQLPDSLGFAVSGLATWGTRLVITGGFVNNGSVAVPGVLTWDGSEFSTFQVPWENDMLGPTWGEVDDLLAWNGKLVAAGNFALVADRDRYVKALRVACWDGEHWAPLGEGLSSPLYTALGEWNGELVAAGYELSVWDNPSIEYVARWNGSTWAGFGSSAPSFGLALQEFQGDLYLGHEDYLHPSNGLARWNGSAWQSVAGGLTWTASPGEVYALCVSGDALIVGGPFDHAGGVPAMSIASWDGTSWTALGAGLSGGSFPWVSAIAIWNGAIIAGGNFTTSGAQPIQGVAMWDGANWQPMGTNAVEVRRMRVADGVLFASGQFRLPDLTVVQSVARWTGSEWHVLGSGTTGEAIEIYDGHLYNAGRGLVHGHVSHGLSRLPLAVALDVPRGSPTLSASVLSASPNPAMGGTSFRFVLPSAGHVRLTVHDLAGRRVAVVLDAPADAGEHNVRWSAPAPPGVYFAHLQTAAGTTRVTRVVRLE